LKSPKFRVSGIAKIVAPCCTRNQSGKYILFRKEQEILNDNIENHENGQLDGCLHCRMANRWSQRDKGLRRLRPWGEGKNSQCVREPDQGPGKYQGYQAAKTARMLIQQLWVANQDDSQPKIISFKYPPNPGLVHTQGRLHRKEETEGEKSTLWGGVEIKGYMQKKSGGSAEWVGGVKA